MEKKQIEKKTRKYYFITSKLVYAEAMRLAKRHKLWWSRMKVTEIGDAVEGSVNIEFTAKAANNELIERDIEYLERLDEKVSTIYAKGKEAIYMKEDKES